MKIKRIIAGAAALLTLLTAGCTGTTRGKEKEKLTVSFSSTELLQYYAPFLQEALPELELDFVVGRGTTEHFLFQQAHGDLPDVLISKAVSARDSSVLSEYMLDLSVTETAGSFYETYLESCREPDGSVKWLPASCVVNGLLANTDLFEEYNVPIPTDYESFAYACGVFRDAGIIPYTSDFKYDYTCLYTLEAVSIPTLMSREGMAWRRNYEGGLTDSLDEELWGKAFSRFETFVKDTGISAEEADRGYTVTREDFRDGKIAMVRGMSNELAFYSEYHGTVLLPYFCGGSEDNWVLTTPNFYAGLNKELGEEKNAKKKEAALRVLEKMFSQEGYEALTKGFGFMLPYNRLNINLPEEFENLSPIIDSNHMYILMTSDGLNSSAKLSIQGYLRGETDIDAAFGVMKDALLDPVKPESETVIVMENEYPFSFDPKKGSQSGSAIANTMRKITGSDALLAPSTISTGNIYAGEYSYEMVDAAFQASGNRVYTAQLTGAEIRELVRLAVEGYDSINDPFCDNTLPVVSGFTITVERTDEGYKLVDISLSDEETYSFDIVDNPLQAFPLMEKVLGEGAPDMFTGSGDVFARTIWADYIAEGNQPEAPTEYIILK